MPSVIVTWKGQCRDRAARTRLIAALEEFAAETHTQSEFSEILRFDGPLEGVSLLLAPRPVNEALTASRELREDVARALETRGGLLVALATEPRPATAEALIEQMKAGFERALAGVPESADGGSPESAAADLGQYSTDEPNQVALPYSPEIEEVASFDETTCWFVRLPDASVHGIQWRLHDPRDLYPDDDRIAFVHLEIPEVPLLDGCLFAVSQTPRSSVQASMGGADHYLDGPSIHLRYYREQWFDRFLGWVKYFHVPELEYFRYEYFPGWAGFEREMNYRLRYQATSRSSLGERSAQDLLASFREEAESWGSLCRTGPEKPVFVLDVELTNELDETRRTLSSADAGDRPELLGKMIDGLLERAGWLQDWRGRVEDYQDCVDEAGTHVNELLNLRRSSADLIRLARHRYHVATLAAAAGSSDFEVDEESAVSEAAAIGGRLVALRQGLNALMELDAAERPSELEARYRRRIGRLLHEEGEHSGAVEELERACHVWDTTDPGKLAPTDLEEMAGTCFYFAGLLEQAGRALEGENRLRSCLLRLKEAHAGRPVSPTEAAGHQWLAGQAGRRGDAALEREHHGEALAAYRSLSRGADRYASRWLRDVAEQLLELAALDEEEGRPEDALARLPEVINDYPTTGLPWVARIELSRKHFHEAFAAALDALGILCEASTESENAELHAELLGFLRDALRGLRERGDDRREIFETSVGMASVMRMSSGSLRPERVVRVLCLELGIASDGSTFSADDLRELLAGFPERIEVLRYGWHPSIDEGDAPADPAGQPGSELSDLLALETALSCLPDEVRELAMPLLAEYPHLDGYLSGCKPS